MSRKSASPILLWTLVAVSIVCFPVVIIKMAVPGFLGSAEPNQRISQGEAKFRILLDTGIVLQRLGRYNMAVSWFEKAEQSARQLSEDPYPFLAEAQQRRAECYQAAGKNDDAQKTYQAMVNAAMEAGDALSKKEQFARAANRFEDAERFAGNLTVSNVQAVQEARARQVSSYFASKKSAEAASVTARMIETQRESADPYDLQLAEYYVQLAYARDESQDWAAAEKAWLEGIDIYNAIIAHYSGNYDPEVRAANARSRRDLATMNLAATYFNEKKMEQALSSADVAYEGLFSQSPTRAPLQLITVGLQSARTLGNQDQEAVWRQRLSDLCGGPNCGQ